jgi:hypothetical protein
LKVKIIFVLLLLISSITFSQTTVSVGGYLGGGQFSGNSVSVGGFTSSLFIEMNTVLFEEVYPRLSFIFTKDFNVILPNATQTYNPFILGVTFKGVTTQYFDGKLFLEEGVGFAALNNQTFSDTNVWDYGVVISISAGFDLRDFDLNGFKLGAGAEYGMTFFDTLPKYSSLHLFIHYTI